ncbi:EF-hand calcium-binding domain-containing protein 6 [Halichoeres trimaculatus]|uniref:EF-hand calcium-binding domain-containing protein 6 n=1 Tax=Halichoeres trimaculatus TaxID=147232 RepID=UPI003D9DFEDA
MSLSEIEKHLKEKIGGNLRNMIRAFRLFDYNRGGHIQLHEFRRILDNYCIRLSDKEFQRLWNHYSPKNSSTISYQLFLEKLGFGDSHNFRISPVCTKLEVCHRGKTPPERIEQKNQRPADPSDLPHRKLQTLFFNKMCVNSTSVWQALQAFDTTHSGLVTQEVLRAVLNSFIFPMNPHSFQKLTSRYGVGETGLVRWKQFLGHFVKPMQGDEDAKVQRNRVLKQPAQDEANLLFQDIYPQLKEIFHLLDQITQLLSVLDPEQTGIIQTAKLEKLNPNTEKTVDALKETEDTSLELKSLEEMPTTQTDDKVPVASASQRTVEDSLQEKLCEQLRAVLEALKLHDPQLSGNVTKEDLKMVLSCYDALISDTQFKKPNTPAQSTLQSAGQPLQPPETGNTCSTLDVVFQRMKSSLEERKSRLADRIKVMTQKSDEMLSERDVRKILEDSSVILGDEDFSIFTDLLGFRHGQIELSSFLQKYEEFTDRHTQQSSEGRSERGEVDRLLTTAEQCLEAMKTRIKRIHGDYLTAFRLMDRRRKGVVDCQDFKDLYNSLGFFCRDPEYEQLLDLLGLHPGGNLNYAEFVDVVENKGKRKRETPTERVQQRLHELLSSEARYRWADMSKVLCPFDSDGQGWIHKTSLRRLLFMYSLPLTSAEFDQLWLRYDPEQRGRVGVCDFKEKLGFHGGQKLETAENQDHKRPTSFDAASQRTSKDFTSMSEDKSEKKRREHLPVTPDAVRHLQSLQDLTPGAALARMEELVTASGSNLKKAFSAFDQSRTGTVTALQFRQVLENFCARLSDKQFRYMLSKLELDRESCSVKWEDFLNKFKTQSPETSQTPDIQRIQGVASDHLHHIPKEPLDPDPSESASFSKEQFSLSLTDDQLLICKANLRAVFDSTLAVTVCVFFPPRCFWSQMPVNEQRKPQHREFLRHPRAHSVTPHGEGRSPNILSPPSPSPEPRGCVSAGAILQRTQSAPRCSSRRPASAGRPGTGSPAGSVERRLRRAMKRCWKEIQRSCREEDPQDEGLISAGCFLRILQSLGISVTQEQFEHLAVKFDIMSNGRVSYHDFLRHFLLNLEPAETKMMLRRRKLPLPTQTSRGVLSRTCVDAMLRIYDAVRSSWTAIRRCFLASDRAHTGNVSMQDFRKVLRHFSVDLSEEEFFHLSSYFDANTTGKICYNNFLWTFLH